MSRIESVVRGVVVQEVSTRLVSNGTKTIWEVITPDNTKWATFNAGLGNKALALKGQVADLQVVIESKGDYTNYYLQGIQAGVPSVEAAAVAAQTAAVTGAGQNEVTLGQFSKMEEEKENRRNASIHRQTATKVAAHLSNGPNEFWANVKDLVAFYATGFVPGTPETSVTSHTAELGFADQGDSDIPFDRSIDGLGN